MIIIIIVVVIIIIIKYILYNKCGYRLTVNDFLQTAFKAVSG
jgi:hypothetical protein